MSDSFRRERSDHLEVWTIDQPDTRNAISDFSIIDAIDDAVSEVNADKDIRVVILTGAGKSFSSGGNLKHMQDNVGLFAGSPNDKRQGHRHGFSGSPGRSTTASSPRSPR
jgi:enoyl-CoA hydratase/carnithine racemase